MMQTTSNKKLPILNLTGATHEEPLSDDKIEEFLRAHEEAERDRLGLKEGRRQWTDEMIDPNFTKARQYLGEAYLQKGHVAKAKEQLMEIADRCGGPCDDYELLVKAIAAHVTGEPNLDW